MLANRRAMTFSVDAEVPDLLFDLVERTTGSNISPRFNPKLPYSGGVAHHQAQPSSGSRYRLPGLRSRAPCRDAKAVALS